MLGRGDDVPERRVHHVHATSGRRGHVDVVDADAGAAYDGQAWRRVEDLRRHLRLAPHDERVDVAEALDKLGLPESGGLPHLAARA